MTEVLESLLAIKSLGINYIVVNKPKIESEALKNAPYGIVYNYFTGVLLSELVCIDGFHDINLIYDVRNKETHGHMAFNEYIHTTVIGKAFENDINLNLALRGEQSHESYGLIAADFLSWSIFRKYEYKDDRFYDLISSNFKRRRRWYV